MKVCILTIGNELLIGETQDTNSYWLCRQLASLGAEVLRVVLLPDIASEIASEILAARQRGSELLITTGGLGPTDDDLTLQAIAAALSLPCELNQQAAEMIENRQKDLLAAGLIDDTDMTPERLKMAKLPQGSLPLSNTVGVAPGVLLELSGFRLIALPGVPAEMQAIFSSLLPLLESWIPNGGFEVVDLWVGCPDESVLAPMLRQLAAEYPEVYAKSKARGYSSERKFNIKLHARGKPSVTRPLLASATDRLVELLTERGITLLSRTGFQY
ncbi:MAG: molybdopterin-binding protein [Acidobacteriota bacterium]|nr:molybdopterin-binding protein [Blastocatellia bacterium]MDW8413146.1 molybdopterin-binding protein [Acidobacteriota bacterium]